MGRSDALAHHRLDVGVRLCDRGAVRLHRDPNVAELAKMKSLVWRAMADGAVGFSTGLQYVPGTYAKSAAGTTQIQPVFRGSAGLDTAYFGFDVTPETLKVEPGYYFVIQELSGAAGCVTESGSGGKCTKARGVKGASSLAVSADGKSVYVVSFNLAILSRNPQTGALTPLTGAGGADGRREPGAVVRGVDRSGLPGDGGHGRDHLHQLAHASSAEVSGGDAILGATPGSLKLADKE